MEFTWEQQTGGAYALDLRVTTKEDGTITVQNLKSSGQEFTYNSIQEFLDAFQQEMQSPR